MAADDGKGARDFRCGQGLKGMRERIEAIGGTLRIVPDLGPGFALIARLPFAADVQ
jgi:signal transduction histidine kinase